MDIVIVLVIYVLLCLLLIVNIWYIRNPQIFKKRRPKSAQELVKSVAQGKNTRASIESKYISTEENTDNDKKGHEAVKDTDKDENGCYAAGEKGTATEARVNYNEFRSFVQKKKLHEEMEKAGTTHGLNKYINDSFDEWKKRQINIAVTGTSGAGKSSLINALRKLKPSAKGAAKVGVVETTTMGKKYEYPKNEFVTLWDLPGIGTQKFTRGKYLDDMKFSRFDVVIIVTSVRFKENDIWLAGKISASGKNVLFVRTKIDMDIMNSKRDYPDHFKDDTSIDKYLEKIRKDMTENVSKGCLPQTKVEIFLVSSVERELYDFKELNEKLQGLINIREKAIPAILKEYAEEAIDEKRRFNTKEFKYHKIASFIYGFLPIPHLETGLGSINVYLVHQRCLHKFCIDEKSLVKISMELPDESKETLKRNLESYTLFDNLSIEKTLVEFTEKKEFLQTKYAKYILRIFGGLISGGKSWNTLQECLNDICNAAAKDELGLVTKILDKLEKELHLILD